MTSLTPQRASVICSLQDTLGKEHSLAQSPMLRGTLTEGGFSPLIPGPIQIVLNHS